MYGNIRTSNQFIDNDHPSTLIDNKTIVEHLEDVFRRIDVALVKDENKLVITITLDLEGILKVKFNGATNNSVEECGEKNEEASRPKHTKQQP
jgi:hypothetical protein